MIKNKNKDNNIKIDMLQRSWKMIEYSSRNWHSKFSLLIFFFFENDIFKTKMTRRVEFYILTSRVIRLQEKMARIKYATYLYFLGVSLKIWRCSIRSIFDFILFPGSFSIILGWKNKESCVYSFYSRRNPEQRYALFSKKWRMWKK